MAIKFECKYKEDDVVCNGEIIAENLLAPLKGEEEYEAECKQCYNKVTFVGPGVKLGFKDKLKGSKKFKQSGVPYVPPPKKLTPLAQILTESGMATLVPDGEYNQGERLASYSKGPQNKDIREGVCKGQCLHWIRRVLGGKVGGRPAYGGSTSYKTNLQDREVRQHREGADAQRKSLSTDHLSNARKNFHLEIKNLVQEVSDTYLAFDVEYGNGNKYNWKLVSNNPPDHLIGMLNTFRPDVHDAVEKALGAYERTPSFTRGWDTLATELNNTLKKKKKYTDIVCAFSCDNKPFGSLGEFLSIAIEDSRWIPHSCLLIHVGIKGEKNASAGAHAIALLKCKEGTFVLFDPNVGVFQFKMKADLKSGISDLIDRGWVNILKWKLTNRFGYAILRKREPNLGAAESIKFTPSLSATALINKTVLPMSTE